MAKNKTNAVVRQLMNERERELNERERELDERERKHAECCAQFRMQIQMLQKHLDNENALRKRVAELERELNSISQVTA